jgi:hypothetical protein
MFQGGILNAGASKQKLNVIFHSVLSDPEFMGSSYSIIRTFALWSRYDGNKPLGKHLFPTVLVSRLLATY